MSSALPKITKKQAIEILDKATSLRGGANIIERANCSEDYWVIIREFRPDAAIVNRLLNEWQGGSSGKKSTKKSSSTKKRTASKKK